jgi:hypothetical protein
MITVKSNINVVAGKIKKQIELLKNKEYLLRPVAIEVIPLMTERIHQKGDASDGGQIGTYSSGYLKLRERGSKKQQIPIRGSDPKVIVSLTRKLEQDWAVIATQNGYGIGFLNPLSLQKARWVEEKKGKTIFSLSKSEQQYAIDRINELVADALNS